MRENPKTGPAWLSKEKGASGGKEDRRHSSNQSQGSGEDLASKEGTDDTEDRGDDHHPPVGKETELWGLSRHSTERGGRIGGDSEEEQESISSDGMRREDRKKRRKKDLKETGGKKKTRLSPKKEGVKKK